MSKNQTFVVYFAHKLSQIFQTMFRPRKIFHFSSLVLFICWPATITTPTEHQIIHQEVWKLGCALHWTDFHLPWWCSHNGENNSNDTTLLWFDVKMDVHFYISNGVYRFITHVRKTPQTLKVVCGCVLLCHYTRKLSVVEVIYTCKDISNTVLNVRGNICSQKMFDRRIVKLMAEHEQRGQCT